tara:strand:- start:42 stop:1772 length:1731 start_codon:yes stop_codon:yes gene_type:complete
MNEEERDLEAELKEEKDRFERQNQEAYDEVTKGNEELRRRQEAEYEKNRRKLKKSREESLDPDRFESQVETIKSVLPDPTDPREVSETLVDMAVDAGILGKSFPEDLPTGIATVFARRMAKNTNLQNTIQDGIGKVAKTIDETTEADNGLNIIKQIQSVFSGELFGITGGSLPIRNIRQNQLMFSWESAPNAANIPQVQPGGLFKIQPRLTRRAKRQVQRPGVVFQKPVSLNITNGFKASRKHRNFEEFIEDLMEADRIPAKNIDTGGFRSTTARASAKYGVELDLYQDYLQGYFNTYDTLDGAMRLVINSKPLTLGTGSMGAKSIERINDINKLFKAYKLNPTSFNSGAFDPTSKASANLLKEFADSKNLDDFLTKNTQLQRHHLLIIDDSFALVKGLTGNDLSAMRRAMNQIGLIAGNDPTNLKFVPQKLHQKFVHGQVWKAFGPEWTGTSAKAKQLRQQISQLPFKDRLPYLEQLKEGVDLTNEIIDNAVDEYLVTKVAGFEISLADKADFEEFMGKLVERNKKQIGQDLRYGEDLIDITQPTTVKSTGKPTNKLDTEIESDTFGQGQMQDDL